MTLHRGKLKVERVVLGVRSLTREDLSILHEPRKVPVVKTLKDSHHRMARLVASGLRTHEIVTQSGYGYNRLNQLMQDPAFQNLVAEYRKMVNETFVESVDAYFELATTNMIKAERQLSDALDTADEAGETLPVRDLIAISRDAADRFGYGKKNMNVNVNVDFAAQLEKAVARSKKAALSPPPAQPSGEGEDRTLLPPLQRTG